MPNRCCVILAAGEGKRMRSGRPKALEEVLLKPMLAWVLDAAAAAGAADRCVVTGFGREQVERYLDQNGYESVRRAVQAERRGTGHAVMMAEAFLRERQDGDVLVLNGDAPLMRPALLEEAYRCHREEGNHATVIAAVVDDPTGYGRVVREPSGALRAIVEQKDASEEEKRICEINSGAFWFRVESLLAVLGEIRNDNAQGEYYLPDALRLLRGRGLRVGAYAAPDPAAALGANDCAQLEQLNSIARAQVLQRLLEQGVSIPCRDGVLVGPDVTAGPGARLLPGTVLCGKTTVGAGCVLGPNTFVKDSAIGGGSVLCQAHCVGVTLPEGSRPAPFSVLRSGAGG